MNKKSIIYLAFIGFMGLLLSCQKEESKVVMLSSPIAPTIKTLPNLTLQRAHGTDTLVFAGTPVNPGFQASATYFLEACAKGNNFKDSVVIYSGQQDASIKITVSDLNKILLKKFTGDQVSSVDFRIRAVLAVDAGTGAPGTVDKPFTYNSTAQNANVTLYGLPRLDLINSGITQKVESALGDGVYTGFVKLDASKAFTFKDPDANVTYGGSGSTLSVNGPAITLTNSGWYRLTVDTKKLTLVMDPYMIGLVGSATPNGWGSPDQKMDYDAKTGTWYITTTLTDGQIKFRLNDGWAWNLGPATAGGPVSNLVHNGQNIDVTAGNYTIRLTILIDSPVGSETGSCTIGKN
ncbi:MAG: SusE domain-containing protein [Bacteroidota bacterium]|nr:SusE domain-containing protein [Bacteroidota bacterium]